MNSRERILTALNLKEPDRVPYLEQHIDDAFVQKVLMPGKAYKIGSSLSTSRDVDTEKAFAQAIGLDSIMVSVKPPFMAEERVRSDGRVVYGNGLIASKNDLSKLNLPDPNDEDLYKDVIRLAENKDDYAALAATRFGLSNTWIAFGLENFTYMLYDDPDFVKEVFETYLEWEKIVIKNICETDIDVLVIADDICDMNGPMISIASLREYFFPKVKEITKIITKPWLYHCCGNVLPIIEDLLDLGMNGMHPFEPKAIDVCFVKKNYGNRLCLVGNIDMELLSNGTPEEVEQLTIKRIQQLGPGGGFILASGNSLTDYCRPENIKKMTDTVKNYGKYPIYC